MNRHRRIVKLEDVMTFLDVGKRTAQYEMAEVRKKYGKEEKDKITVTQFCECHKYIEEEFVKIMMLPDNEKRTPDK